jgi:DNA-binding Lrp family transcriptional regulator
VQIAYVLVNSDLGKEQELVREIKTIEGVEEVYFVYGLYDLVVKVAGETMQEVKDAITWKIRRLENIRSTITLLVVE